MLSKKLAVLGNEKLLEQLKSGISLKDDSVVFYPLNSEKNNEFRNIKSVVCFLGDDEDLLCLKKQDSLKNKNCVFVYDGNVSSLKNALKELGIEERRATIYLNRDNESNMSILSKFVDTFLREDLITLDTGDFNQMVLKGDYILSERLRIDREEGVKKILKEAFKKISNCLENRVVDSVILKFLGNEYLTLDRVFSIAEIIREKYFYVDWWSLGVSIERGFSGLELIMFLSLKEEKEDGEEEGILSVFDE